ncbi:MAG: hypothetical protein HC802_13495, partial [Caldilineaceae bacterium]|nr:hypothetical protein [Caldilineaceae bacterium]
MRAPLFLTIATALALFWAMWAGLASARPAGALTQNLASGFDGLLDNGDFECAAGYYTATNPLSQTLNMPDGWQ